jgi:hypothetical protein
MYRVYAASNVYKVLPTIYEDVGVIGTAAAIQEENFESIVRFTPFSSGEFMLDLDGELRVDTFAREYQMTVHQLVSKFGIDNVSAAVKDLYDRGDYSSWIPVSHVIEPVGLMDFDEFKIDKSFKWRSVQYETGRSALESKFLSVKGYHEFPILAPRWDAKAGDTYGFSPGMDALGDARALQVQEREKGKAVAKMVAPPTVSPSAMKKANISLLPGANNFSDDPNNIFRPIYQVNPRVDQLAEDIRLTEDRINRAFYVDLFLLISRQDDVRSATEIAARQEEKLLQLGPVLEGLHDELLDPMIDRTFSILMRLSEPGWKGTGPILLPPPPQELRGSPLKVEYISMLAQAQKMIGIGAIERWAGFVGNLSAMKPAAMDKVDEDAMADQMAEDLGVPPGVVRDDSAVADLRKARAEQENNDKQRALMAGGVETAKTLSETSTEPGNALSDVVGIGGGRA